MLIVRSDPFVFVYKSGETIFWFVDRVVGASCGLQSYLRVTPLFS